MFYAHFVCYSCNDECRGILWIFRRVLRCITHKNPEIQQNLVVDYLFFRAIEDTLKYGETNFDLVPPPSHDIEQDFSYNSGVRATINIPTYDRWLLVVLIPTFGPILQSYR